MALLAQFQRFVAELNHFYLSEPALWQMDGSPNGFSWIDDRDENSTVVAYERKDIKGNKLYVAVNFSTEARNGYILRGVIGEYDVVFNSDDVRFGGSGKYGIERLNGEDNNLGALSIDLPPQSFIILKQTTNSKQA